LPQRYLPDKKVKYTTDKNSFLGIKPTINPEDAGFFVLSVPFEKTTTYGTGTKNGPKAIINASAQVELYDDELNRATYKKGIYTYKPIDCKDDTKNVFKKINSTAKKILRYNGIPFFLGGEHSISHAIIPAFLDKYKNVSILHFDAHADLRSSYESSAHSHACAMHPFINKCPVVQVGIRSIAEEEIKFVNKGKITTLKMQENPNIKKLTSKVIKNLTGKVYVSIDVDGFDPSVIPATGTPEPGGFNWYDALYLFKKVFEAKKIIGVDVVELSPLMHSSVSEFTIAKFIYRLMGYTNARSL